jgi:hypothetical protein
MALAKPMKTIAFAIAAWAAALGACAGDVEPHAGSTTVVDASIDHVADVVSPPPDSAPHDAAPPIDAPAKDAAAFDGGPCNVRIDAIPLVASPHVPDGTSVVYTSNPPSSGPHYNEWANFQEFTHEVDDRNLVHSLEHGAVELFYKCDDDAGAAACDALVSSLRALRDAFPTDPSCDPAIRVRIILAPRSANDVPIAAAAWGNIYRADCFDAASLTTFMSDHYNKATEDLCAAGQVF